jgi:hypothetical protein
LCAVHLIWLTELSCVTHRRNANQKLLFQRTRLGHS